jgi:hypothetical protein
MQNCSSTQLGIILEQRIPVDGLKPLSSLSWVYSGPQSNASVGHDRGRERTAASDPLRNGLELTSWHVLAGKRSVRSTPNEFPPAEAASFHRAERGAGD